MKKLMTIFCFVCLMFVVSCRQDDASKNVTNVNANSTPRTVQEMASGNDAQVKQKIEENWKKVGCTGATVEVKDGVATGRGTVPKGKLRDCVQAAQEAGPGKFVNELVEAK